MCSLWLFAYLPVSHCVSLWVCVCMLVTQCVRVAIGTCFITSSLPRAASSSGTQEHMCWMQIHTPRKQNKKQTPPQTWLHVHWVFEHTHERKFSRTKEHRKCKEATAVWSMWQQTGHCGECGRGFRQGIGYREQALLWWKDADLHSYGLTKDYFRAFWTLPRKHNNFGVSSFIYLLCFSI